MIKIAIFASGAGSNAENIVHYFRKNKVSAEIPLIISNKVNAMVHERAKKLKIESVTYQKSEFETTNKVLTLLQEKKIDYIVLAGFLLKIPDNLLIAYPNKIINIHPALLPKFGGKGMYGDHVHKAVAASGENRTGITIHMVNKNYDEGTIIFQAACKIEKEDNYQTIAHKVHQLEYTHYPRILEKIITQKPIDKP